jgi:ribosomal protein L20A (L18A)
MKLEVHRVNSRLKVKRVDVRIEAVEKVVADAGLL